MCFDYIKLHTNKFDGGRWNWLSTWLILMMSFAPMIEEHKSRECNLQPHFQPRRAAQKEYERRKEVHIADDELFDSCIQKLTNQA